MKVLAVGGGGREHAAVEALSRSGSEIYAVMKNANPGIIARSKEHLLCDEKDVDKVVAFAKEKGVELAFVGPEAPLEKGIVDALEAEGIPCAAPTKAAARIETSKTFMRELVEKHGIAGNLGFAHFDNAADAEAYVKEYKELTGHDAWIIGRVVEGQRRGFVVENPALIEVTDW